MNQTVNAVSGNKTFVAPGGGSFSAEGKQDPGNAFSMLEFGNQVEFFVTGEDYFKEIAEKIKAATTSIFICAWELDFDVMLNEKERLIDCLRIALDTHPQLRIYAMPWFSPKVAVNTHDLEALCALSLLNAGGKQGEMRVFVLPALSQATEGTFTAGFSHHQKVVVIDNEIAYIGGLDLAYGRRDDETFSLQWQKWRIGCERYNPCVPPVKTYDFSEKKNFISTMSLVANVLLEGEQIANAIETIQTYWKVVDGTKNIVENFKTELNDLGVVKAVKAAKDFFADTYDDLEDGIVDRVIEGLLYILEKTGTVLPESMNELINLAIPQGMGGEK